MISKLEQEALDFVTKKKARSLPLQKRLGYIIERLKLGIEIFLSVLLSLIL